MCPDPRRSAAMENNSPNAELQGGTNMKTIQSLSLALTVAFLSENTMAAVGPNYRRPAVPTPGQFADSEMGTWKESTPADQIARGDWWNIYHDPILDGLERQAAANNQDLKAAVARVTQA